MVLALGSAVSWSMTKRKKPTHHLTDEDYRTLAAFRTALRHFTHFSETAAKSPG